MLDDDDVEKLNSLKMAPGAAIASMMGKDELKAKELNANGDSEVLPGDAVPPAPEIERLAEGQRAPFDVEAT